MDIEQLRKFCLALPHATEDIKWEKDLCFLVGNKIFCVSGLYNDPFTVSLKVKPEEFDELTSTPDIIPAPYLARYKWITIQNSKRFNKREWEIYIQKSYELVKSRLPKRTINQLRQ